MAALNSSLQTDTTRRVPRGGLLSALTLRVPRRAEPAAPSMPDSVTRDLVTRDAPSQNAMPQDATLRVSEAAAVVPLVAPDGAPVLPLGILAAGAVLCGDCIVSATIRPHETTRPGLFDCQSPQGRAMIKIAAAQHPPRPELWERLPSLRHPALLKTHRVAMQGQFFCEIQEFCEGGTLDAAIPYGGRKSLPWETIERGIVAPFLSGLAYLHRNGIVHRDVKPRNLYLRKRNGKVSLVIGDFDISSLIESDLTSRDTVRAAGTHFYMAPEAFPRFVDADAGRAAAVVTPASDYYSFGVVLVELLQGTTSLHAGRWSDVYDFYMAGGRIEIPHDLPSRARELIQGLLIRNRRTRWGEAQVERWLRGATSEADRQQIRDDAGFDLVRRSARPYNVFPSQPTDLSGLARAMLEEPIIAEEELMSGDILVNWIGELDIKLAREIRRDREKWLRFPRVAAFHALMRLDPTLPFPFGPGLVVASIEQWESSIEGWIAQKKTNLGKAVSRTTLMNLEAWLRGQTDPRPDLADGVAILREFWWPLDRQGATLNALDVAIAWEEMKLILHPTRPYLVARGIEAHTPLEIAQECWGRAESWQTGVPTTYRTGLERWQQGHLGAWLRQRLRDENGAVAPVVAQIDELRRRDVTRPEANFEAVLRLLDSDHPLVEIRLESGEPRTLIAEHGEVEFATLRWSAWGAGLPYGVWRLDDAPAGLHAGPVAIDSRAGELRVTLETLAGLQPGSAGTAFLSLEPGGTCALPAPIELRYRVRPPDSRRRTLIRNGVFIGAGIAGGTRLLAFGLTGRQWLSSDERPVIATPATAQSNAPVVTVPPAPPAAPDDNDPPTSYLAASVVILLGGALAFYVWIDALRKFGQT